MSAKTVSDAVDFFRGHIFKAIGETGLIFYNSENELFYVFTDGIYPVFIDGWHRVCTIAEYQDEAIRRQDSRDFAAHFGVAIA